LIFSIKGIQLREDKPASSFVVSLGKALNGIASTFEWLESSSVFSLNGCYKSTSTILQALKQGKSLKIGKY